MVPSYETVSVEVPAMNMKEVKQKVQRQVARTEYDVVEEEVVTMVPEVTMQRQTYQMQRMVPERTMIQVPQQTMEPVQIQVPRMVPQEHTVMVPQTTTEMVATQVPRQVIQEVQTVQQPMTSYQQYQTVSEPRYVNTGYTQPTYGTTYP